MSEDLWTTDSDTEDQGPKALRDHLKKLEKQLKERDEAMAAMKEENAKLAQASKKAALSSTLNDLKVPTRLAKWMEKDGIDTSKEAVEKWLSENGEDFGFKPGQAAPTQDNQTEQKQDYTPAIDAEDEAMLNGWQALDDSRPANGVGQQRDQKYNDIAARFQNGGDPEEYFKALQEAGFSLGASK